MDYSNIEPIFSISTAAKLLDISVHTLRMYEREGLIISHKTDSGQRLYSMKDIERIESIRNSINKYKISIAGIKTILAMVPCWKLVGCGENEDNCKAYKESTKPCWKIKHRKNYCAKRDCKECDIYNNFGDATAVKQELVKLFV